MKLKLLFIVNVDWFFISHRLPIALEAIKKGYEVHIACGITNKKKFLEENGLIVHSLPLTRSGTSISAELKAIFKLWRIVKYVKPDIAHLVTIKGAIYGGIVTRILNVKARVIAISGLGYVFIDNTFKIKFLRFFIKILYRFAINKNSHSTKVIFQNSSDKNTFLKFNIISSSQVEIIRGSGVDLNKYKHQPEPSGDKVVMFLARLLKDKGVVEFCEAAKILANIKGIRFVLVGDIDVGNPNSLSPEELKNYINSGYVEYWGHTSCPFETIPMAHLMVLPSYREGLPKSLLEAAACGRAVITTDVPGCRDAININTGVLVKVKSAKAVADAINTLLNDDQLRVTMGQQGRLLVEAEFNVLDVTQKHMDIYRGII